MLKARRGRKGRSAWWRLHRKEAPSTEPEWELVNEVLTVIRSGGDAADLLRRTTATLLRMARLEAAEDERAIETGTHQTGIRKIAPEILSRTTELKRLSDWRKTLGA